MNSGSFLFANGKKRISDHYLFFPDAKKNQIIFGWNFLSLIDLLHLSVLANILISGKMDWKLQFCTDFPADIGNMSVVYFDQCVGALHWADRNTPVEWKRLKKQSNDQWRLLIRIMWVHVNECHKKFFFLCATPTWCRAVVIKS